MFMHKKYSRWQRLVMAVRDVVSLARCSLQCPGCGSFRVTGDSGSWICHACGSQGQS